MDNTLIYGLATLLCGIIGLVIRYGFKSKCTDVNMCCGMIAIKRDVNAEIEEEKMELENGVKEDTKV